MIDVPKDKLVIIVDLNCVSILKWVIGMTEWGMTNNCHVHQCLITDLIKIKVGNFTGISGRIDVDKLVMHSEQSLTFTHPSSGAVGNSLPIHVIHGVGKQEVPVEAESNLVWHLVLQVIVTSAIFQFVLTNWMISTTLHSLNLDHLGDYPLCGAVATTHLITLRVCWQPNPILRLGIKFN